jgi:hypothetical protein
MSKLNLVTARAAELSIIRFREAQCAVSAWNFNESRQYEPDDRDSSRPHDSA